jgi:hypothetical protein
MYTVLSSQNNCDCKNVVYFIFCLILVSSYPAYRRGAGSGPFWQGRTVSQVRYTFIEQLKLIVFRSLLGTFED